MANKQKKELLKRGRRQRRTRAKIIGTKARPRLSVFRSSKHIYVQAIDDNRKQTLAMASDRELADKLTGQAAAQAVGRLIAEKLTEQKIKQVIFDRGSYQYHGQVKALAEAARSAGLQF